MQDRMKKAAQKDWRKLRGIEHRELRRMERKEDVGMSGTGNEIAKIAQTANRLSMRVMREEGLGPAESDLVRLVREQPGIQQKTAGETLGMDKGAVARRVVNLEKKGYLARKNNPADARSQILYPAKQAQQIKDSDASAEEAFYQWLLGTLSEEERAAFCEIVHKLSLSAEQESSDGFPNVCELLDRPAFETESVRRSRPRKPAGAESVRGNRPRKPAGTKLADDSISSEPEETENEDKGRRALENDTAGNTTPRRDPDVWLL